MNYPEEIIQAREITLAPGHSVFRQGDSCASYVVVMAGSVKVFARSAAGKEIVLYHIHPGEICVLTTSCLLGGQHYPAEAVTESVVTARIIPKDRFTQLIAHSPAFREFVFASFSSRLANLISLVEQIALESIEQRLARYLLEHADSDQILAATHHHIAFEIGSAREVVSRNLKNFENRGLLTLQRGRMKLLDLPTLKDIAQNT